MVNYKPNPNSAYDFIERIVEPLDWESRYSTTLHLTRGPIKGDVTLSHYPVERGFRASIKGSGLDILVARTVESLEGSPDFYGIRKFSGITNSAHWKALKGAISQAKNN